MTQTTTAGSDNHSVTVGDRHTTRNSIQTWTSSCRRVDVCTEEDCSAEPLGLICFSVLSRLSESVDLPASSKSPDVHTHIKECQTHEAQRWENLLVKFFLKWHRLQGWNKSSSVCLDKGVLSSCLRLDPEQNALKPQTCINIRWCFCPGGQKERRRFTSGVRSEAGTT